MNEDLWQQISDDLPESFWRVSTWLDINYVTGALDIADRKRIGMAVIAAVQERQIIDDDYNYTLDDLQERSTDDGRIRRRGSIRSLLTRRSTGSVSDHADENL